LVAHGTNLGIAAMGQIAQGITIGMLQHVAAGISCEEMLKAASAILVNYHSWLFEPAIWRRL
jgi:hypothetical protein